MTGWGAKGGRVHAVKVRAKVCVKVSFRASLQGLRLSSADRTGPRNTRLKLPVSGRIYRFRARARFLNHEDNRLTYGAATEPGLLHSLLDARERIAVNRKSPSFATIICLFSFVYWLACRGAAIFGGRETGCESSRHPIVSRSNLWFAGHCPCRPEIAEDEFVEGDQSQSCRAGYDQSDPQRVKVRGNQPGDPGE
jgi:hypothetical protein